MEDKITSIQLHESTWKELNKRKKLGESHEDLIKEMLLEFPVYKKLSKSKNMTKDIKEEINNGKPNK